MKSKLAKIQGLSLLELLIALAIFAIFITPMLTRLYASNVTSILNSQDQTLANYVAQNHIAQLQIDKEWPSAGTQTGETEFANRSWQWQQKTENTSDENMRRITVTLTYGKQGTFSMVGFVAKPDNE